MKITEFFQIRYDLEEERDRQIAELKAECAANIKELVALIDDDDSSMDQMLAMCLKRPVVDLALTCGDYFQLVEFPNVRWVALKTGYLTELRVEDFQRVDHTDEVVPKSKFKRFLGL